MCRSARVARSFRASKAAASSAASASCRSISRRTCSAAERFSSAAAASEARTAASRSTSRAASLRLASLRASRTASASASPSVRSQFSEVTTAVTSRGKPRASMALTTVAISPRSRPENTAHRRDPNSPPRIGNVSSLRGASQSGSWICSASIRGRSRYACGTGKTGTSWPPSSSSNSRTRGISSARNPASRTAGGPSGSASGRSASSPEAKPMMAASCASVRSLMRDASSAFSSVKLPVRSRRERTGGAVASKKFGPGPAAGPDSTKSAAASSASSSSSQRTVSRHSLSFMSANGNTGGSGVVGASPSLDRLISSQSSSKKRSSYPVAAHSFSISATHPFSGGATGLPSLSMTRPCSSRWNSRKSPDSSAPPPLKGASRPVAVRVKVSAVRVGRARRPRMPPPPPSRRETAAACGEGAALATAAERDIERRNEAAVAARVGGRRTGTMCRARTVRALVVWTSPVANRRAPRKSKKEKDENSTEPSRSCRRAAQIRGALSTARENARGDLGL